MNFLKKQPLFQIHPPQPHQTGGGQAVFGFKIGIGGAILFADGVQHKGGRLRVDTGNALIELLLFGMRLDLLGMGGPDLFQLRAAADIGPDKILTDRFIGSPSASRMRMAATPVRSFPPEQWNRIGVSPASSARNSSL